MQVIAEVKTHSPYGWESSKTWEELFDIAQKVGSMVAIHTESPWHGSVDLVKKARSMTDKPILAKGIHADDNSIELAVEAGADQVLVVGRIPSVYADRCLIEPCSLEELTQLPTGTRAVWNSRDLSTGGIKPESFTDARNIFTGWLCQASNIRTAHDIQAEADAILVGTYLPELAEQLGF